MLLMVSQRLYRLFSLGNVEDLPKINKNSRKNHENVPTSAPKVSSKTSGFSKANEQ